jgi:hypothetical protein
MAQAFIDTAMEQDEQSKPLLLARIGVIPGGRRERRHRRGVSTRNMLHARLPGGIQFRSVCTAYGHRDPNAAPLLSWIGRSAAPPALVLAKVAGDYRLVVASRRMFRRWSMWLAQAKAPTITIIPVQ